MASRIGNEYICNNKKCARFNKIQGRVFDVLDEFTCRYCEEACLIKVPYKSAQIENRNKKAKQELSEL